VKDPKSGVEIRKTPFVAYFQTGPESALAKRVKNVCLAMSANMYDWPRNAVEAKSREDELQNDLKRNDQLLKDFKSFMVEEAEFFAQPEDGGNSKIENYRLFCKKEKSAYTILNLFTDGMTYRCDVWFPKSEEEALKAKLRGVKTKNEQQAFLLPSREAPAGIPPTYVQTNDFLEPWQGVINTYGIPSYKTANPVAITSVTFPFIFGMMYGDVGHGSMLFCAGLFLMWRGSKPGAKYDFPLYSIRFVITQMGFFAVFAGLMYNDLFGMVSFEMFPSRFEADGSMISSFNYNNLAECGDSCDGPYPFGLDHGWHGAANELLFQNSLKMKLSVCVGVLQMLLGVFLRFSNAINDGSTVDLVCECIPMLIFMVCFFGYMDCMIVYKWTHKIPGDTAGPDGQNGLAWPEDENGNPGSGGAPSIINSLICMGMHQTDKAPLFPGSQDMASMLMLASAISVPWLLVPKPLILKAQNEKGGDKAEGGGGAGGLIAYVIAFGVVPYLLHLYTWSWKSTATYYAVLIGVVVIQACKSEAKPAKDEEEVEEVAPVVDAPPAAGHGHGHGEFEFGEVLIHQVIETIEYVLGTISHTASYLRIWALSLAHQQLSAVFYKYTLLMAFSVAGSNPIMSGVVIYLAFGAWIAVTIGVLLGMDVLECFLHTLRLHWVEFQSKFYRGDGQWFCAYNIKAMLMDE
jgi:V-type H+-transporting ATPase subunit a